MESANPRKSFVVVDNRNTSSHAETFFQSYKPISSTHACYSQIDVFGPCVPRPLDSSFPSLSSSCLLGQPPLLPLPLSNSMSLSDPSNKVIASIRGSRDQQQNRHHRKPKTVSNSRKETLSLGTSRSVQTNKGLEKPAAQKREEEKVEAEEIVYPVSPPPSSLPLPRFSLIRPKPAVASCTAEAMDDLRGIVRI